MRRLTPLCLLFKLGACDDDGSTSSDPAADAAVNPDGMGADPDAAGEPPEQRVPESGTWALAISLQEFGGLVVPFHLELETTAGDDGGGTIDRASLRAVKEADVSAVLAEVVDATVSPEGDFTLDFGTFLMPGEFSPTAGDIELSLVLTATWQSDAALCGGVTGEVITLSTVVTMSTFGAVPLDSGPVHSGCDDDPVAMLPRVEACPDLVLGRNEGFTSGGVDRDFVLMVPADHADGEKLPLVMLHHGLAGQEGKWGNVDQLLTNTNIEPLVDSERFILVVPASRGLAVEWTADPTGDNEDLAFFDDVVKCADDQFGVDPDRVHAMGHSAGAIYTVYLAIRRSEALASAAAMSPALTVAYTPPEQRIPMIVGWGGVEDEAFGQDFHANAATVLETFGENDHFLVACDHSVLPLREDVEDVSRHTWPTEGATWMVRFLLDHPRGVMPLPYVDGLPESMPEYCAIPQ